MEISACGVINKAPNCLHLPSMPGSPIFPQLHPQIKADISIIPTWKFSLRRMIGITGKSYCRYPKQRMLQACHHGALWEQVSSSNRHNLPICSPAVLLPPILWTKIHQDFKKKACNRKMPFFNKGIIKTKNKQEGHWIILKETKKRKRKKREPTIFVLLSFPTWVTTWSWISR